MKTDFKDFKNLDSSKDYELSEEFLSNTFGGLCISKDDTNGAHWSALATYTMTENNTKALNKLQDLRNNAWEK